MDTYSIMRAFADSWFLIAMFVFFIGAAIFAFRPGSKKVHDDIANIPFRHEDKPAGDRD
ncbi:cbb3-type cytochrome c oxidase subunit 3 [Aliiroseovarius sp. KMU-50]|uniref:Cbb3-type cytochrome c oxidase subunit 3 n=2 Tax=Aliiroseovarius salicola TaxID=3009082 RepID=A0ABT4W3X4_9RHOB|nr:cbb3-type cytochrome c oxidase subunit 3 [Aliiroseovarius sp. KMU-50]MDA5095181.1 cbb3-type cytochrome c oxidase subunit 3 [Aliiroseovarius sp. KMU-50]